MNLARLGQSKSAGAVAAGRKKIRLESGSAAFELVAASLIMISVVAFALNVCMALIAYTTNDRACRDAARSAAQGASVSEATQRASRILLGYSGSAALRNLRLERIDYNDFAGRPPSGVSPFVKVITSAECAIPCPISVFGNDVFRPSLQIRKVYTFPIVKLTVPL